MKSIFVHITDFHFTNNTVIEKEKHENLMHLLLECKANAITFLLGGDIAYSGSDDEYERALSYFKKISTGLGQHSIKSTFICVPGNHDLQYKKGYSRERSDIKKLTQKIMIKEFGKETRKFDNYYSFDNELMALNDDRFLQMEKTVDRYINHHVIEANSMKFDIFTLNNSMYSYYDSNEQFMDNEKGIFQVIHEHIEKIKRKSPLSILLMHFPFEYFSDSSRNEFFQATRRNIDIILTGHIHENYINNQISNAKTQNIIQTGAFSNKNSADSAFAILQIDSANSTIDQYVWNNKYRCFQKNGTKALDIIPFNFIFDDLEFKADFIQDFYKDTQNFCNDTL